MFNYSKTMNKVIIIMAMVCLVSPQVFGQRDTTKTQSIDITSSFKPVLRNSVKINFSGSQLPADTNRASLAYNIPSQNLFYAYQPISLRPLALVQDTNLYLGNRNYLKAGFGNFNTPYVAVGLGFGDGKTSLVNLTAEYIASKGNDIQFQDYNQLHVKGAGSYFTPKNEVYGSAAVGLENYYLYGYDHNLYNYTKSDIRQQFQDITLNAGVKNIATNSLGINYNPNVELNFFTNKDKLSETNIIASIPVDKLITDELSIKVTAKADLTNYATKNYSPGNIKFGNNIFQLAPAFEYNTELIKLHGGVTPTWNNGEFVLLPDTYAELKLEQQTFLIQAGWVGRFIKNNFRNLSAINPYLGTLTQQNNTKEIEYYGGIKASVGKHFNFSGKAGFIRYTDLPIFINDIATDEKTFVISNETKARNLRLHGDISYIMQDKFTATAGVTFNGYTGLQVNEKAWHTVPVEFTGSLRWWAFERLLLKTDLYFYNGGKYLTKNSGKGALPGATDLSVGAEFKINKQFGAWMNINNVLNDKYERWHNYQVYGTNFTAGILIHF